MAPNLIPDDHLFEDRLQRFVDASNVEDALKVIAEFTDELLSDAALTAMARRVAAESDPARREHLQERHELLAELRIQRQQMENLSPVERLFLRFTTTRRSLDLMALVTENADEDLDALDTHAEAKLAVAEGDEAEAIWQRLDDLRRLRGEGRDALEAQVQAMLQAADLLIEWIRTPDWDTSERFLAAHAGELLTTAVEDVLALLLEANPGREDIQLHRQLLRRSREIGSAAAYAQLRQELATAQELAGNPLLQHVVAYLQVEDGAARDLLASQTDLLLTLEARQLMAGLLAAARQQGEEAVVARFEARLAHWQAAWQQRLGGPRRRRNDWEEQPQSEQHDTLRQDALAADQESRYVVATAINSAIGDNAQVLNIVNVGELPLRWQRPLETRPWLAAVAVGRETELAELHRRLAGGDSAALVAQGTAAAVRGQPGIGKTTLAAMYVARHAASYPGGVLWLEIGPGRHTRPSLTPVLQRIAAYAYDANPQASALLENVLFGPEVVQMLLRGHGAMLAVVDDVWSAEAVAVIKEALPAECAILLTTRDYNVAFALEKRDGSIYRLDVLSQADARLLLQHKAPGLPSDLADAVADGLGRHAQALALAAGALAARKVHRYARTAADLLEAVRQGRGFGNLPRLDQTDQHTDVEIALRYSYDYLGETIGSSAQAHLRALGSFAPEADFDTAAAAALWAESDPPAAEETLLLLDGLGLLQETEAGGRWQQHAILRAYALGLQDEEEYPILFQRHADYYLALVRACYEARPRDYDRIELEFKQIEHAFDLCQRFSPARVLGFVQLLDDFMRNRGRVLLLHDWLGHALRAAAGTGDLIGKANTLQSLGDLEQRLGNIEAARQHYDDALPLYEAEQARLGKANTLQSLGDLERRLGNIETARQHYDDALPLYEAEQARLGKANTLQSLGDLERRLGNIETARQHYDDALQLYYLERNLVGEMNVYIGQAHLAVQLAEFALAVENYERVFDLADQIGFSNHPITLDLRREYEALKQFLNHHSGKGKLADDTPSNPVEKFFATFMGIASPQQMLMLAASTGDADLDALETLAEEQMAARQGDEAEAIRQRLESLRELRGEAVARTRAALQQANAALERLGESLVAWIQTPDWAASEAYLSEHADELLGDDGQAALELLHLNNPDNRNIPTHITLLRRSREVGITIAYQELYRERLNDPVHPALAALFSANSTDGLNEAIEAHPILLERPALDRLAEMAVEAHEAGQTEAAQGLLARLAILLEQYNHTHAVDIDPAELEQVVDLHLRLLPLAETDEILVASLQRSAGWSLNSLGAYFADKVKDQSEAIAAFSRAIEIDNTNAMLLRNRASTYIEIGDYIAARIDIERATALEPAAERLPQLRGDLYASLGDGPALLAEARLRLDTNAGDASPHFYLSLGYLFQGDVEASSAAMQESARQAADEQRQHGLETLARLAGVHADHAAALAHLAEILKAYP